MQKLKLARIHHARKAKGLSLDEVAAKLHVNPSTVHRWETFETAPRREHAPSVAAFIGCALGELLQEYAENVQKKGGSR